MANIRDAKGAAARSTRVANEADGASEAEESLVKPVSMMYPDSGSPLQNDRSVVGQFSGDR